jgi:hypothetical protein
VYNYEEACREKIRFANMKLKAEKEKIQNVLLRFKRRQEEYNAIVNKEMMEGLHTLNDRLLKFFDGIDRLSVNGNPGKKLKYKIETLMKIAEENRDRSHKILGSISCPDYPQQRHFQRKFSNNIDLSKEKPPTSSGQTFFSLLSIPLQATEPKTHSTLKVVK